MKILNCPFCGSKARQFASDPNFYSCSKQECPAYELVSYLEEWNNRTAPIKESDDPDLLTEFKIGTEFICGGQIFRVTDVGSRMVLAICLDQADERNYNGPPYSIAEQVFDENDQGGCLKMSVYKKGND